MYCIVNICLPDEMSKPHVAKYSWLQDLDLFDEAETGDSDNYGELAEVRQSQIIFGTRLGWGETFVVKL